jgi:hypothetical protein
MDGCRAHGGNHGARGTLELASDREVFTEEKMTSAGASPIALASDSSRGWMHVVRAKAWCSFGMATATAVADGDGWHGSMERQRAEQGGAGAGAKARKGKMVSLQRVPTRGDKDGAVASGWRH